MFEPLTNSRRSQVEALAPGETIGESLFPDTLEAVPATVTRLHKLWSTAVQRVRSGPPASASANANTNTNTGERQFALSRSRRVHGDGRIEVKLTIRRIA